MRQAIIWTNTNDGLGYRRIYALLNDLKIRTKVYTSVSNTEIQPLMLFM